jgi:hypothetical protein
MDALLHAVRRAECMGARARAGLACRALCAAARSVHGAGSVAACISAGARSATLEIAAFVDRAPAVEYAEESALARRCIADAAGSVWVFAITDESLRAWGAYGHRWHLVTLVLAAAVNVPRWRDALVASGREADRAQVYCAILRAADARSAAWGEAKKKSAPPRESGACTVLRR